MTTKSGPSILLSLLFFSLIVGSSLAARNLNEDVVQWVKRDHRRFLRAVILVADLDRSIKLYTRGLGMRVWKRRVFPDRQYRDALIGFGPETTHFLLELRQRLDSNNVFIGTEFGHFGIATTDLYKSVEKARAAGWVVTHEPERNKTVFVQDGDGYRFKLLQRAPMAADPLCEMMLRVEDVARSVNFYGKALGMSLFQRRYTLNGQFTQFTSGTVGYGTNPTKTTLLELQRRDNNTPRDDGRDGYSQVYIGTDNVNKSAEAARVVTKELGGNLILEPFMVPGINVKMTGFTDPDNWRNIMVDNKDYQRGGL